MNIYRESSYGFVIYGVDLYHNAVDTTWKLLLVVVPVKLLTRFINPLKLSEVNLCSNEIFILFKVPTQQGPDWLFGWAPGAKLMASITCDIFGKFQSSL